VAKRSWLLIFSSCGVRECSIEIQAICSLDRVVIVA
jgi:hypothetical protein